MKKEITDINIDQLIGTVVKFFANEEKKCKEKQLHFVVNEKVSQNPR